ncbi:MAG: hypothetical protein IPG70_02295 [Moraxellaceae bacterium]|nr:hypothetical protein [Moraxellaceae bacterium]
MPTNTPRNPEHRAKRVDEQAEDAPERTFEQRNRSVSIERADVKKETEQYLRQQYTNDNGEMICQACKLPYLLSSLMVTIILKKSHFLMVELNVIIKTI